MENEKIYFLPGDLVTIRLELPNKPVMLVVRKETSIIKPNKAFKSDMLLSEDYFKGIRCRWFTTEGELQEAVYNTKDLIKL